MDQIALFFGAIFLSGIATEAWVRGRFITRYWGVRYQKKDPVAFWSLVVFMYALAFVVAVCLACVRMGWLTQ